LLQIDVSLRWRIQPSDKFGGVIEKTGVRCAALSGILSPNKLE
jgi:hypothetical protein